MSLISTYNIKKKNNLMGSVSTSAFSSACVIMWELEGNVHENVQRNKPKPPPTH